MKKILKTMVALSIVFSNVPAFAETSYTNDIIADEVVRLFNLDSEFVGYSVLSPEEGDVAYVSSCFHSSNSPTLNCLAESEILKTDLEQFFKKMKSNRYYRRIFNIATQSTVGLVVGAAVVIFLSMAITYWVALPLAATLFAFYSASFEAAVSFGSLAVLGSGALVFNYSLDLFGEENYDAMVEQLEDGMISRPKQVEIFEKFLIQYSRPISPEVERLGLTSN